MDRDKEIELMKTAPERLKAGVARWLQDERVKAALRKHHEAVKGTKPPPTKQARG